MSFVLESLRDKPTGLWLMSGTAPFLDSSGYAAACVVSATPPRHTPLVNGAADSSVLYSGTTATFTSSVFSQGNEDKSFSLELGGVRPIEKAASNGEQQLLGNNNKMDGLVINGTIVSFVTKYLSAGEARVSYDIQQLQNIHVVGVHSVEKNSLYINGLLVGETNIDGTQQADKYVATDGNLYSGATSTSDRLAVNAVGVYPSALASDSVVRHYRAAKNTVSPDDVSTSYNGDRFTMTYDPNDIFLQQTYETQEHWNNGVMQGTSAINGRLTPQLNQGVSISSDWHTSFALSSAPGTTIYGVNMTWDGSGVEIAASLNGVDWEVAEQGRNLSIIPNGFNPTDKILEVKATFAAGVLNDNAFLDNLKIVGLRTGVSPAVNGRAMTLSGNASIKNIYPVNQLHDNWGVELEGGSVTFSASTDPSTNPVAMVSAWIKRTGTTLNTSIGGTYYVRGVSTTLANATPIGEWSLVFIDPTNDISNATSFSFTGNAEIAELNLFGTVLSAITMNNIERSYMGIPVLRVGDNSIVAVTEAPISASVYTYDWNIQAVG